MALSLDDLTAKVDNGGVTPDGLLTAEEYNTLLAAVKENAENSTDEHIGSVVVDNTLSEVVEDSNKPVSGAGIASAIEEASNNLKGDIANSLNKVYEGGKGVVNELSTTISSSVREKYIDIPESVRGKTLSLSIITSGEYQVYLVKDDGTQTLLQNWKTGNSSLAINTTPTSLRVRLYTSSLNAGSDLYAKLEIELPSLNAVYEAVQEGFLLASSVSGWKSSRVLYIDYVHKNDSTYGSGIRIKDESGNQVLYTTFSVGKKRVGIEKIVEQKDDILISLVVNWDFFEDGFNKVLDYPIYLPELSFLSDTSESLSHSPKIKELSGYVPHHFEKEATVNFDYLHDEIDFVLKKGAKIINNGIHLIIASDITLSDKVYISKGSEYVLDSDKTFLTAETSGFIDFDYIPPILGVEKIGLALPNTIYAIVGDTLQIFYRGLMSVVNPYHYDILVSCNKGKQYPRYFEYTPTSADVGETTFRISVKNSNGEVIETKSCKLITCDVPSSSNRLNIACFGDSLTEGGSWCAEAYRRLTKTDGNPVGIGLSSINFVGKEKANNGAGYYGEGGWRWNLYVTEGARAYRFYVTNVNLLSIGSQYTHNGSTFTINEINVTEGSGNILCSVVGANNPQSSGVLTKSSGNGDASVSFTSCVRVPTNPLWDTANNKMSFIPYANEYADGQLDVVYVLLGWNDVHREAYPYPTMMADCKKFIDTLHTEFPSAKVKLMGLQVCSINGGMGANYGAIGSSYADTFGTIRKLMELNQAYKDFAESSAYSSFVEYVDIASQFDSENNMPSAETKVNTRSSMTERRGTNGVHPSYEGYMQIADVVYRNIIANL